jgi:signal transduction histidine kinase
MNNDEKFVKYGKTLSGLIHNLNTPLMGISGRIELMQMKFGDDKNITQVITQLDKINATLTNIAYLIEKEQSNKDSGFDLKVLLENYFDFLTTDMRFKHKVEKEISLTPHNINTNGSDLINFLHCVFDQLLAYVGEDAGIVIENSIVDNNAVIDIKFRSHPSVEIDKNIKEKIQKRLFEEIKHKYEVNAEVQGNTIIVKLVIKSEK